MSSEEEKDGSVSSVCFPFILIKMYAPDKEGAKSTLYHIFVQNLYGVRVRQGSIGPGLAV